MDEMQIFTSTFFALRYFLSYIKLHELHFFISDYSVRPVLKHLNSFITVVSDNHSVMTHKHKLYAISINYENTQTIKP